MADNAAAFSGGIPENYDRYMGPVFFAEWAKVMAARAAAHRPGRVLETAAGTGIVSRALRDALPVSATLVSTDLNAPMLDVARKKFRDGEAVTFQPADATSLPFENGSFDAVVCQFGVMFFPDKDKGYREAHRVLAPGGRFLFSVWDAHRYNPAGKLPHEVIASFFPSDPPPFYQVPYGYTRLDEIRAGLESAGFGEMKFEVLQRQHDLPSAADFARGLVYGTPVYDQIRSRGGVDPEAVVEKIRATLDAEFGSKSKPMPQHIIMFEAVKA